MEVQESEFQVITDKDLKNYIFANNIKKKIVTKKTSSFPKQINVILFYSDLDQISQGTLHLWWGSYFDHLLDKMVRNK